MKKIFITTTILLISIVVTAQKENLIQKNSTMKKITFNRDNLQLAGHLFVPNNFDASKKYAAVLIGGSLTSVKEQMSGIYADKLAQQGIIALAFDYSHYGESEGFPRQFEDPEQKLKDLQAAVTYLESLDYVSGIGALGVCTSGGNMAYLAEADDRIKAVITVAAWLPNEETLPLLYGSEENLTTLRELGNKAKEKYETQRENEIVLAYSDTDKTASHFGPMEYYMDQTRGGGVKEWKNEFSVMSWPTWLDFDPMSKAENINTPVMVIHSDGSALPDNAKKFYNNLSGEKELVWLEGYHFDFYDQEKQVNDASDNAIRFIKSYIQ